MKYLVTSLSSVFAASLPAICEAHAQKTQPPPNVILILADDLSVKELSCYGH